MVLLKLIWDMILCYPLEAVLIISAVIMAASIRHSIRTYRRASLPMGNGQQDYRQVSAVYTKR